MKFEGFDELTNILSALGSPEAVGEAVSEGLHDGARKVQSNAKRNCPVDTSHLRNSITVEKIPDGYEVGTNVEYAPYQEYGTGRRGDTSVEHVLEKEHKKDGKGTGEFYPYKGIPPQPFLYPALKMCENDVKKCIADSLKNAIRRARG